MSVVEDSADAEWPSMPRNAVKRDHVDQVAPLADFGATLSELSREKAGPSPLPEEYPIEDRIAAQEFAVMETDIGARNLPTRWRAGRRRSR